MAFFFKKQVDDPNSVDGLKSIISDRDAKIDALTTQAQPVEVIKRHKEHKRTDNKDIAKLQREITDLKFKLRQAEADLQAASTSSSNTTDETVRRLESKLKNLEVAKDSQIQELEKQVEWQQTAITQLEAQSANKPDEKTQREIQLLRQDRGLLQDTVEELEEKVAKLQDENKKLRQENMNLSSSVTVAKKKMDEAEYVPIQTRSKLLEQSDRDFQEKYGLPNTEFVITYYACLTRHMAAGYLYITPRFIIFDTYVHIISEPVVMAINDIVSIDKTKWGFLPGKGSDLEIKSKKGDVLVMKQFIKRKQAVLDIMQQAKNLDHTIISLRNGAEEQ